MSVEAGGSITCGQCGRSYRWKPELAGRKVKCTCGATMEVAPAPARGIAPLAVPPAPGAAASRRPQPPPARKAQPQPPPAEDPDDIFAVAGEAEEASAPAAAHARHAHANHGHAHASNPASDLHAALADRGLSPALLRRKGVNSEADLEAGRREVQELAEGNVLRDWVAPVVIIGVGIALLFGQAMTWNERPAGSVPEAFVTVATRAVLSVGLMVGGIWLAVAFMEVTLIGSFVSNLLKLAATALGPAGVYDILRFTVGGDFNGPAAGAFAAIALYALLFLLLMRMDARDTAICTMVTFILVAGANYAAFRMEGFRRGSDI